jgi:hypothetical protein
MNFKFQKMKKSVLILTMLFITLSKHSFAQSDVSGHSIGVAVGPSWALTDLGGGDKISTPFLRDLDFPATKFGISVFYRYTINEWVGVRANLLYGMLEGSDRNTGGKSAYPTQNDVDASFFRKARNLDFRTHIFQFNAMAEVNLKRYDPAASGRGEKSRWAPYLGGGVGLFTFNPFTKTFDSRNVARNPYITPAEAANLAQYEGEKIKLRKLGTEGSTYSPVSFNLTALIGIKFNITEMISVFAEGWYNQTFTDRLDDVSSNYPNMDVYQNMSSLQKAMAVRYYEIQPALDPNGYYANSIWAGNGQGQERGDDNVGDAKGSNDQFFTFQVGVAFKISGGNRGKAFGCGRKNPYTHKFSCPKW